MKRVVEALCALVLASASVAWVASCATSSRSVKDDGKRVAPDEPWRSAKPASGPVTDFKLPVFQKAELKNGMALYVIEDHGVPMVSAAVFVRAGSAMEGPKEAGLAELTYDMLDEGAGSMNNLQLANAFAALGTRLQTGALRELGFVSVDLLKKHADAGLDLLQSVVRKPSFAQADFDRVRAELVAGLKEREGDPTAIADTVEASLVFGGDHAYGHDERGTPASLEKLTRGRVQKFWSDNAGPKNAALVVAGDITLDEAKALGEKHFGKWSGSAKAPKAPPDPKPRAAMKLALVDVPGAPQSVVRAGRAVMARGDPDEGAMIVFNEILGGSFSSRLNLKLREEKQWTYGASSGVDLRLGKGPFAVATDVQTPNTGDAVAEILAQFDAIKTGGVTDDEVARAKEGYSKSLPGYLGTPMQELFAAGSLFAYGLPADYYDKRIEAVKVVKADDVKKIAERILVKEDMVVVVVGDKASVEAKLKEKNLGDVAVYNRDGTEVPAPK